MTHIRSLSIDFELASGLHVLKNSAPFMLEIQNIGRPLTSFRPSVWEFAFLVFRLLLWILKPYEDTCRNARLGVIITR